MKSIILFGLLGVSIFGYAQQAIVAEPVAHYKTLQQFSAKPDSHRAWMDTIKYPPTEYGTSIVYILVKPHYLTDSQVVGLSKSVTFPANSSEQVRKELDYLLELQARRTPNQVKRVEFLANVGYWPSINLIPSHPSYQQNLQDLFFQGRELIGEPVQAKNFPAISRLLQGVMQDMRVMEFTIKYKLLRPRPYHLESSLKPLARINSPSFVSGHTLWAFIQAFTWGEIIAERKKDFLALAEEIRRSREIMGIHYPSDNEKARIIAIHMFQFYLQDKTFQKDFQEAVAEWKSVAPKVIPK